MVWSCFHTYQLLDDIIVGRIKLPLQEAVVFTTATHKIQKKNSLSNFLLNALSLTIQYSTSLAIKSQGVQNVPNRQLHATALASKSFPDCFTMDQGERRGEGRGNQGKINSLQMYQRGRQKGKIWAIYLCWWMETGSVRWWCDNREQYEANEKQDRWGGVQTKPGERWAGDEHSYVCEHVKVKAVC